MHGPTPLFLTRSINQHRKKYTNDGMRIAADRLLTINCPALYRCDHVVPPYQGVIQSTACEEPNFEHVFEVVIVAAQTNFFDRPIRLDETFLTIYKFSMYNFWIWVRWSPTVAPICVCPCVSAIGRMDAWTHACVRASRRMDAWTQACSHLFLC